MSTYSEKLKHPNWQRKRLEILSKHKFMCQVCGAEESTLHVHHGCYVSGLEPWQYPDQVLHVLCEDCHPDSQELMSNAKLSLGLLYHPSDLRFIVKLCGRIYKARLRENRL